MIAAYCALKADPSMICLFDQKMGSKVIVLFGLEHSRSKSDSAAHYSVILLTLSFISSRVVSHMVFLLPLQYSLQNGGPTLKIR